MSTDPTNPSMEKQEKTTPSLVKSEVSNVIDFQTRETLIPRTLKNAIIGQYAESKTLDHSPAQFFEYLEKRVIGEMAYAGAKFIRESFESFGKNDDEQQ